MNKYTNCLNLLSMLVFLFLIRELNGKGFISNISELMTNQRKGRQFFNLKNNDFVLKVFSITKSHIACVTKLQKLLIFDTSARLPDTY